MNPKREETYSHLRGAPATQIEAQILCLLVQGMSNPQIGRRMYRSPETIKRHVERMMTKFDCRNRVQLAVYAIHVGLVL